MESISYWDYDQKNCKGHQRRTQLEVFLGTQYSVLSARYSVLGTRYSTHSYRKLSTGSSCEARVAGTVPKMIPTTDDTTIAMIADNPEIGRR